MSTDAQGARIEGLAATPVIGDAAYDADLFRAWLVEQEDTAVIPANPSRSKVIAHD